MADKLRELNVLIASDISSLSKGLNAAAAQVGSFASEVEASNARLRAIGATFGRLGTALTVGVSVPLGIAGYASVKMASDFEESLNKTRVVFKEGAGIIEEFAGRGAKALGLSQQQALESAGTFGNLFTSMGMTREESARMSTAIVQLGVDLASFNNIKTEEALYKLRAGLVGEAEPLRTLGVQLTETAVAAKAMEMGLAETTKQLTASDKVTARYALIIEQTKNAQGDFARTADGMANQMRTVGAQVKDLGVQFGQVLLPTMQSVLSATSGLLGKLNELEPATRRNVIAVGAFALAFGPLMKAIQLAINATVAYRTAVATLVSTEAVLSMAQAWKTVGIAMAGAAAQVAVVAAAFAPFLKRINDELQAITSTAGTAGDAVAKAMVSDPALFEQQLAYLDALKEKLGLSGESWAVETERTYENARAILFLTERARELVAERQKIHAEGVAKALASDDEAAKKATGAMLAYAKAIRGLKSEYGVMTRGDVAAAMKDLAKDFSVLSKEGASAQELMAGFSDKVNSLAERAGSYKDLAIPEDFKRLAEAMSEKGGSIEAVGKLAEVLKTSVPAAAEQAQAGVVEIFKGDEIAQVVSGGFGRGIEEGISFGDQQLEAWRSDVGDRVWKIKLDLDTEEAERKLGELRDGYRKAGAPMP